MNRVGTGASPVQAEQSSAGLRLHSRESSGCPTSRAVRDVGEHDSPRCHPHLRRHPEQREGSVYLVYLCGTTTFSFCSWGSIDEFHQHAIVAEIAPVPSLAKYAKGWATHPSV